jgi:hypothetical protein
MTAIDGRHFLYAPQQLIGTGRAVPMTRIGILFDLTVAAIIPRPMRLLSALPYV